MKNGLIIAKNGDKYWYQNGLCHRVDGPAIELVNGTKYWFINGKLHREDGPAIEKTNGTKHWYQNGNKISEEKIEQAKKLEEQKQIKEERTKKLIAAGMMFEATVSRMIEI